MQKVDGKKIYLTRADSGRFKVTPKVHDPEYPDDPTKRIPYTLVEGDRIVFRLKRKAEDIFQVVCAKDCDLDIGNNKAFLYLEPEDTQNCEFKEYRYEFELITHDDFHSTFIENEPFTIGKELEIHGQ